MKYNKLILMLAALLLSALQSYGECECDGGTTDYDVDCDGDGIMDACDTSECSPCSDQNPNASDSLHDCCGDVEYLIADYCCDSSTDTLIESDPAVPPTCVNSVPSAGSNWMPSIPVNITTNKSRTDYSCGEHVVYGNFNGLPVIIDKYTVDTYTTTGTLSVPYEEEYEFYQSESSGCGADFTGSNVTFPQAAVSWSWSFGIGYAGVGISASPSTNHISSSPAADDVTSPGDYRRILVDIYKRKVKPAGNGSFSGTVSVVYGCNPPNTNPSPQTHADVIASLVSANWRVESLKGENCDVECCP